MKKRTVIAALIILIAIPATIYLGWRYADRQYYIVSLLIIVYTMIPFFLVFEKRRPKARELAVLAVLCAIAVVSRIVFIWFPAFKPMTAVIIIVGMSFGAESGFLCGAVTSFVSNFVFGQGPWTPWQMFAYGIAGFLAGLLTHFGILKRKRVPLSIFGFLLIMLIVGPLLDTCSVFTELSEITWEAAKPIYIAGVPINLIHSAATVLMLFFFSKPMLEKLDRIQLKYGMMEE